MQYNVMSLCLSIATIYFLVYELEPLKLLDLMQCIKTGLMLIHSIYSSGGGGQTFEIFPPF